MLLLSVLRSLFSHTISLKYRLLNVASQLFFKVELDKLKIQTMYLTGKIILERFVSAQYFDKSNFPALSPTCFARRNAREDMINQKFVPSRVFL